MRFNTLGTFEVTHEDRLLTPTAPKQRSVLALLVLCHGGLVPVTSLIEEIWPENPPASALTTLQTYIYQLRKLFCAAGNSHDGVLVTKPLGYLARIAPGSVDADEFEQLAGTAKDALEAADPLRASQLLHRATALWRGDALCDVQRGPLLDAHAAKLNEAWLQALGMRVEADLQIGRHRELVGELRGLIAKYPLHEDLYAKLMLALYRCDRRSQALQVYHEVRRCLDDELGIDPSPTLQRLHQNVLSDSPSLRQVSPAVRAGSAPAPRNIVQAQLPADLSDFTGRTAELAELDRLLAPEGAAGRTFAVTGMTGVGKTVLAVRAAHEARSRFPDGQLFAEFGPDTEPADVLGGFLTDLGVPAADVPAGEAERAKLFRTRTAGGCGLILLDNVSSAAQIRPLLPGGRWVVLATARRLTGSLPGLVPVLLEPMSTDDGVTLMSKVVTSRNILHERGTVAAVVHRCGGLPVALRALGERLSVNRHWPVTKLAARVIGDDDGLRPELQAAGVDLHGPFREDLAALEPRDRQLLTRLCESGLDCFTAKNAVAVVEGSEREAEDALDRLVAANMLRVRVQADGPEFHYSLPPLFKDFCDGTERPSHLLQVVATIPREAETGIAVPG